MNIPAVSVLMPVYNGSPFLKEAIESILGQSFRDFEFIIIDDGSSDDSHSIISQYDDARIRVFSNGKNLGISATLNKGIGLARAALIARMDADDISYRDRLQKQYDYMQRHAGCALLSTWAKVVTENRKFVRLERYRSNFYYYNLTFECWIYHPTVMFRKQPVEALGMYIMPYSEDYDLFWRLSAQFEIGNIAEPLVEYRLSPTSLNTVLRKREYDLANEQNVLRNIRFYMGAHFTMPTPYLECLRHNFKPLIECGRVNDVLECLSLLERITERILERDNVNRDVRSVRRAFYFKKKFILREIGRELPAVKRLQLLLNANAWLTLYTFVVHSIGWRLRRVVRLLL